MTQVTRGQRVYFAAVGALALWVGVWGYFVPERVDIAIPWLVPPLHARFLGAMYLSGAVVMTRSIFARRWWEVRIVVPMIAIWTGMLFVVSLFYLNEFDFTLPRVWIWFAAYIAYPLIGIGLAWRYRREVAEAPGPAVPDWIRRYLLIQGVATTGLALALLLLPGPMVSLWPWPITPLLAQIYSAPFLSYGLGSLMIARRRTLPEIRFGVTATGTFALLVLVASFRHAGLFSTSDLADWIWFGGFLIAAAMLGVITARAYRRLQSGG